MRIACRRCGRKFKNEYGVGVHARRMHRVEGISGAAETVPATKQRRPLQPRMVPDSIAGRVVTLRGAIEDMERQLETLREQVTGLGELVGL